MSARSLVVVSAGLSSPSATRLLADRLRSAAERALVEDQRAPIGAAPVTTRTIELREFAQDLTNNLLTGFPSPALKESIDSVVGADGLIAVTPIFTASYSGLFKLFFDVLDMEPLADKPVLIGATGGTPRHSLALEHALRPLFAYLGAAVVPTAVYAAAEDWGRVGSAIDGDLSDRIGRAGRQLAAAMLARPDSAPVDPYADPTPFEELLRRQGPG